MPAFGGDSRLRRPGMSRRDWFRFKDREAFNPTLGAAMTTHRFLHQRYGEMDAVDWEQEEWTVRALLVPIDTDPDALEMAARAVWAHDVEFTPWWIDEQRFEFAES